MNILIVTENFAPSWAFGGPPKVLFDAARELTVRNHSVTVYATNILDKCTDIGNPYSFLEGIHVYYLKTYSKRLSWHQKIFLPVGLRGLLRNNLERFDVVMLTSNRTFSSFWTYHYCRVFDKPYILVPYGSLPGGLGYKKLLTAFLDPVFGYNVVRDASLILVQTEHEMEEAKKHGSSSNAVRLLSLNVDFSEFQTLPARGEFRRGLGLTSEKMILFLGRLHKNKGLGLLLRAFKNLSQKDPNLRLVIVGRDDGYLSEMRQLIISLKLQKSVIFAGAIYGKDRINVYVDADVFVLPSSHYEETSTAALEACASSTPVVLTHQASIPGLDLQNVGFTIDYDQSALQTTLEKLLDDDRLRIEMGKNARKFVCKYYSTTTWADRLEGMLTELKISGPEEKASKGG